MPTSIFQADTFHNGHDNAHSIQLHIVFAFVKAGSLLKTRPRDRPFSLRNSFLFRTIIRTLRSFNRRFEVVTLNNQDDFKLSSRPHRRHAVRHDATNM
jgi:hypothetical protein